MEWILLSPFQKFDIKTVIIAELDVLWICWKDSQVNTGICVFKSFYTASNGNIESVILTHVPSPIGHVY